MYILYVCVYLHITGKYMIINIHSFAMVFAHIWSFWGVASCNVQIF